jgi:hypothetical protein
MSPRRCAHEPQEARPEAVMTAATRLVEGVMASRGRFLKKNKTTSPLEATSR